MRLFVDASYGVHVDGKSHTGSCVVIAKMTSLLTRTVPSVFLGSISNTKYCGISIDVKL